MQQPFFVSVVATLLIAQVPPIVFGLTELGGSPNCLGLSWLLGAIVFGVINVAANFCLAVRMRNAKDPHLEEHPDAWDRAAHSLCRDPCEAIHSLIVTAFFVFLCLGSTKNWSEKMDEDESCSDAVSVKFLMAVGFGWFFVFGGAAALAMSMCCAECDDHHPRPRHLHLTSIHNHVAQNQEQKGRNRRRRRKREQLKLLPA
jgi:hypothetical protein